VCSSDLCGARATEFPQRQTFVTQKRGAYLEMQARRKKTLTLPSPAYNAGEGMKKDERHKAAA
jgi:hypothetical protein